MLSQLQEPKYGYSLVQDLAQRNLSIDQGTLYPLLRRLEKQGLLSSDWSVEEACPRRYYVLSDRGKGMLDSLATEWDRLTQVVGGLLSE